MVKHDQVHYFYSFLLNLLSMVLRNLGEQVDPLVIITRSIEDLLRKGQAAVSQTTSLCCWLLMLQTSRSPVETATLR